ncbi:MAG: 2Fe-2S iron-sulfur cluster-binding protein, partial [Planctomycetota bacterium]
MACGSGNCGCNSNRLVELGGRRDLGTPRGKSAKQVTLTIDGQTISAAEGTSIMRAAAEAGIPIPKLCATEQLNS